WWWILGKALWVVQARKEVGPPSCCGGMPNRSHRVQVPSWVIWQQLQQQNRRGSWKRHRLVGRVQGRSIQTIGSSLARIHDAAGGGPWLNSCSESTGTALYGF